MRRLIAVILLTAMCALCGCSSPASDEKTGDAAPKQAVSAEQTAELSNLLSRYAELSTADFDAGTASREEIIELVYGYISLHEGGSITQKPLDAGGTMYGAVRLEELNRCSKLLFGRSFDESEMQDYIVARYTGDVVYSMYRKGEVYFLEKPAHRANIQALVTGTVKRADGSLLAEFDCRNTAENSAGISGGRAVFAPAPGTAAEYCILSVAFDREQQTGGNR